MEVIIPFLMLAGVTVILMRGSRGWVHWRIGEYGLTLLPLVEVLLLIFTPLNRGKTLSNFFVEGLAAGCLYLLYVLVRMACFRNRPSAKVHLAGTIGFALVIFIVFCAVPNLPE